MKDKDLQENHLEIYNLVCEQLDYLQAKEESSENKTDEEREEFTEEDRKDLEYYFKLYDELRKSHLFVEPSSIDISVQAEELMQEKVEELKALKKEKKITFEELSSRTGKSIATLKRLFGFVTPLLLEDYFLIKLHLEN